MKKYIVFMTAIVLAIAAGVCLTACGTSELTMNTNSEKSMSITAENADSEDFVMAGTLDLAEGEKLTIEPALDEGIIELGFVSNEGMDDIEELPDTDAAPQFTVEVSGTETQVAAVPEGSYLVRATVRERATGTIEITIQ